MQRISGLYYFALVISVMVQLGRPEETLDSLLQEISTLIAKKSIEIGLQPKNISANVNHTVEIITRGNDPITNKLKQIILTSENLLEKAEEIKAKLVKLSVDKVISSRNAIERAKGNDVLSEKERIEVVTEDATDPHTKGKTGALIKLKQKYKDIPKEMAAAAAAAAVNEAISAAVQGAAAISSIISNSIFDGISSIFG